MKLNMKLSTQTGVCFVCAAPALAAGTADLSHALACGCILLLAGCGAVGAVRLSKSMRWELLTQFFAIMISMALSLGGELIASAAFPNLFNEAPTFALTGATLFFAACFSLSAANEAPSHSLCCVLAAALLVVLLGAFRAFFGFLPLSENIAAGLISAGIAVAVIRLLLPSKEETAWEA